MSQKKKAGRPKRDDRLKIDGDLLDVFKVVKQDKERKAKEKKDKEDKS